MNKPDGGPAFPMVRTEYDENEHRYTLNTFSEGGMSLRDYFAGQAMNGELAAQHGPEGNEWSSPESLANWAYRVADAMLKEREK